MADFDEILGQVVGGLNGDDGGDDIVVQVLLNGNATT
jgi:hypothetical protein